MLSHFMCCKYKIHFDVSGCSCRLYELCVCVCVFVLCICYTFIVHIICACVSIQGERSEMHVFDVFVCVTLPRRVLIDKVIRTATSTAEPSGKAAQVCVYEKERDR